MRPRARWLAVLTLVAGASTAQAIDRGQFDHVPADVRAWFKALRNAAGVPCCDVTDGHRTAYEVHDGRYWVPIDGVWMRVPDVAVIRNAGNPVGEAIVWYVSHGGVIIISCFVPADAV